MNKNISTWCRVYLKLLQVRHTCLELCGGIEFRLNCVQLHPEMLLIHLDSVTTFSLNLLFNQHLPRKQQRRRKRDKYVTNIETEKIKQTVPGPSFKPCEVIMVIDTFHFTNPGKGEAETANKCSHNAVRKRRRLPAALCERGPSVSSCTGRSLLLWWPGSSAGHWCHWRLSVGPYMCVHSWVKTGKKFSHRV